MKYYIIGETDDGDGVREGKDNGWGNESAIKLLSIDLSIVSMRHDNGIT